MRSPRSGHPGRAGRKDVALALEDAVGSHRRAVDISCHGLRSGWIDVGHEDRRATLRETLGERRADSARTLDEDVPPSEVVRPEDVPEAGADPCSTPTAVGKAGLPEPPASTERPKTYSVRSPMTSMSASPVFMSELVRKVPPNDATRSP